MSDQLAPERLRDLEARLRHFQGQVRPRTAAGPARPTGPALAFEIAGHLIAGLLLGGTIGYFLDRWLESAPFLFVAFFFMGAAAGMVNVYRTVTGLGMAAGYRPCPAAGAERVGTAAAPAGRDAKKSEG